MARKPLILSFVVMSAMLVSYVVAQGQAAQLPAGISDLLGATSTMLSPLDLRAQQTDKTTNSMGNTITISGSQIVFARSDTPTLVATITSLIENSEPSAVGNKLLTSAILSVLDVDASDAVAAKQIEETIACRPHKETLRQCVKKLVDVAVAADQADQAANETITSGKNEA